MRLQIANQGDSIDLQTTVSEGGWRQRKEYSITTQLPGSVLSLARGLKKKAFCHKSKNNPIFETAADMIWIELLHKFCKVTLICCRIDHLKADLRDSLAQFLFHQIISESLTLLQHHYKDPTERPFGQFAWQKYTTFRSQSILTSSSPDILQFRSALDSWTCKLIACWTLKIALMLLLTNVVCIDCGWILKDTQGKQKKINLAFAVMRDDYWAHAPKRHTQLDMYQCLFYLNKNVVKWNSWARW